MHHIYVSLEFLVDIICVIHRNPNVLLVKNTYGPTSPLITFRNVPSTYSTLCDTTQKTSLQAHVNQPFSGIR